LINYFTEKKQSDGSSSRYRFIGVGGGESERCTLLGTLPLDSELVYARWYNPNEQLVRFVVRLPQHTLLVAPGFQTIKTDSNQSGNSL